MPDSKNAQAYVYDRCPECYGVCADNNQYLHYHATRDSSTELRRRRIGSKGENVYHASRRFFQII